MLNWNRRAVNLSEAVRDNEAERPRDYSAQRVRTSVVHTREDVVMLVSYLETLNEMMEKQVSKTQTLINWVFALVAIQLIGAAIHWWHLS